MHLIITQLPQTKPLRLVDRKQQPLLQLLDAIVFREEQVIEAIQQQQLEMTTISDSDRSSNNAVTLTMYAQ